MKCTDEMIQIE